MNKIPNIDKFFETFESINKISIEMDYGPLEIKIQFLKELFKNETLIIVKQLFLIFTCFSLT